MRAGIVWLIAILLVAPFLSGCLPVLFFPEEKRTLHRTFLLGVLLDWFAFDLCALYFLFFGNVFISFEQTFRAYCVVLAALGIAGLLVLFFKKPLKLPDTAGLLRTDPATALCWLFFFAVLFVQLFLAVTYASFDGDDAFYVVESLMSEKTGTMYNYVPYTGESARLDIRHALAVIPMWEAFVARVSGIHATIIAHTVLPVFLIPLTYLVYYGIGKSLFKKDETLLPVFLSLLAIFQVTGNTSIYTTETFFLTRTWQGKAMMGNLVLPMILLVFCAFFAEDTQRAADGQGTSATDVRGAVLTLVLINCFAGMCTSMGVVLAAGEILLLSLLYALKQRRMGALLPGILSCVPNVCYILLYMRLK